MAGYKKGSKSPLTIDEKTNLIEKYKEEVDAYTLKVAGNILDLLDDPDNVPLWEQPVFNKFYMNPASGTKFNLENSILLYWTAKHEGYKHALYLTAKQGFENGMSMEKGTKGHFIVQRFGMKMYPLSELDSNGQPIVDENGKKKLKRNEKGEIQYLHKRCAKLVKVFNIEQFTGPIPEKWLKYMKENENNLSNEEELSKLKDVIFKSIQPEVIRHLSKDNYYVPNADVIYLSEPRMFKNTLTELSVTFHEWSHSTGHKNRLNRPSLYDYHTDKAIRGFEELVANFSARRLCNFYNMENSELSESFHNNHDSYDTGWAYRAIQKGPEQIFKAAADADRAFNLIRQAIEPNLKLESSLTNFLINKIEEEEPDSENKPSAPAETVKPKRTFKKDL